MPTKSTNRTASAADILGVRKPVVAVVVSSACVVCGTEIPKDRLEALRSMKITDNNLTCMKHSTTTKKKGIYLGEVGTSQLLVCNKVYNDSVRSVFKHAEASEDSDDDQE